MKSVFIREVNRSNILHIYEYALYKEMTTYTVWDAYESLHNVQKCIEEIVNEYEKEKLAHLGIFRIENSFKNKGVFYFFYNNNYL